MIIFHQWKLTKVKTIKILNEKIKYLNKEEMNVFQENTN